MDNGVRVTVFSYCNKLKTHIVTKKTVACFMTTAQMRHSWSGMHLKKIKAILISNIEVKVFIETNKYFTQTFNAFSQALKVTN